MENRFHVTLCIFIPEILFKQKLILCILYYIYSYQIADWFRRCCLCGD